MRMIPVEAPEEVVREGRSSDRLIEPGSQADKCYQWKPARRMECVAAGRSSAGERGLGPTGVREAPGSQSAGGR